MVIAVVVLKIVKIVALWTLLVVIALFFGIPLVWLVLSAFDPNASPEFRIPSTISLRNFMLLVEPVSGVPPLMWIVNSAIISTLVATIVTITSILAAYVLTRYSFRGQGAMLTAFIVFRLIPPLILALPIMILYRSWGMMDTIHGLVLAMSALILPFTMMIAESFLRSIPVTYEEAAMIDGCTRLGSFLKITLPLAAPGIATIWLLSFVTSWSQFVLPLMIIKTPSLMPASVGLQFFFGEYGRVEYGKLSAFSILYSLPVLIVFLAVQKYLKRGIAGLVSR